MPEFNYNNNSINIAEDYWKSNIISRDAVKCGVWVDFGDPNGTKYIMYKRIISIPTTATATQDVWTTCASVPDLVFIFNLYGNVVTTDGSQVMLPCEGVFFRYKSAASKGTNGTIELYITTEGSYIKGSNMEIVIEYSTFDILTD